jgi:hypothetical protein
MKLSPRILVASLIGLVMVGGSYLISKNPSEAQNGNRATAVSVTAARDFIAVADQDSDGLPDWQNTFNINTINLDEAEQSATMTKTATLAADLATHTFAGEANVGGLTSLLRPEILEDSRDPQYGREDIAIGSDDSLFSLRAYGNSVAAIAIENAPPPGTESELIVLNRALLRNDPTMLEELAPTIAAYEEMLEDMLTTEVPPLLVKEHLSLINVYQALASDIQAFKGTFDDALPAMMRFRRYQADAEALYAAIAALYQKLDEQGIEWTEADIASKFIKIGI